MNNKIIEENIMQLKAGNFPVVIGKATIASGQTLDQYSLLGEHLTNGKSAIAGTTDYPLVNAILLEDIDASQEDVVAEVMLTGEINGEALIVEENSSVSEFVGMARKNSIFIKELY